MDSKNSTWITRYKSNKKTIELYQNFFFSQELDTKSKTLLLEEITRLEYQNKWIESMTQWERRQDDSSSITIIESRLHLIPNEQLIIN